MTIRLLCACVGVVMLSGCKLGALFGPTEPPPPPMELEWCIYRPDGTFRCSELKVIK